MPGDYVRVGDYLHRRAVYEYVVVLLLQGREHGLEPAGEQELRRVRRDGAHRQEGEVLRHRPDAAPEVLGLAREIGDRARAVQPQALAQGGLPQVEVQQQGPGPLERSPGGHVHDDERLARVRVQGGDYHGAAPVSSSCHHVYAGPEHTERLVDRVASSVPDHDAAVGRVEPVLLFKYPCEAAPPVLPDKRYLTEERHLGLLYVLPALDGRVGYPQDEEHAERYPAPEDQGHQQEHHPVRGHRARRPVRGHDEPRVPHVHQPGYLVLLTLLEEVDVQGLLHLLLPLDGEELHLRPGAGGYPAHDLLLLPLEAVGLQLEGGNQVVDGAYDGGLHRVERGVHVKDQRVLLAAARKEAVTGEDHVVVLGDLALYVRVGEPRIGRYKVPGVRRVGDVSADVPGDGQLVVHVERLGGVGRGLLQVCLRGHLDVGQLVLLLELLQVGLYTAEFLLYDYQALVDEGGGVPGGAVLVVYPCLVVHVDQCAEDVLGPGREHVLEAQDYHRCLLSRDGRREPRAVALGLAHAVHPGYRVGLVPAREVHRRGQDEATDRRHEGVGRTSHHPVGLDLVTPYLEVAQHEDAVLVFLETEAERGLRYALHHLELHRGVSVVLHPAESLLFRVGGLEAEALHHRLHEVRRGERLHLVVHVLTRALPGYPARERGQVTQCGVLPVLIDDHLRRPLVCGRGAVEIDRREDQAYEDGEDVPPLVGPYHLYHVLECQRGRLVLPRNVIDILWIFCHIRIVFLFGEYAFLTLL